MRPALKSQQRTIAAEQAQSACRAQLPARIDYWNRRGGAPKALYPPLQTKQTALHQLAATLQAELRRANASIAQFNAAASTRNRLVSARNLVCEFGSAQLGAPSGLESTSCTATQKVAIAHQFGHIFGIDHIRGPENIMYPSSSSPPGATPARQIPCPRDRLRQPLTARSRGDHAPPLEIRGSRALPRRRPSTRGWRRNSSIGRRSRDWCCPSIVLLPGAPPGRASTNGGGPCKSRAHQSVGIVNSRCAYLRIVAAALAATLDPGESTRVTDRRRISPAGSLATSLLFGRR